MAMGDRHAWSSWLRNHERQIAMAEAAGYRVQHFAAIQIDGRGVAPFVELLDELDAIGGQYWTYSLDDGRTSVTMTNRWRHITFGQNLVVDYCQARSDVSHLLFLAADCAVPSDIVPRMLEMEHPLVAPFISTYALRGPTVDRYPYHVEDAMASAAAIFIERSVFRRIRWRWDADAGMSDDPCYHHDALTLLGVPTYVRHDVLAKHFPESVGDYESRGYDTAVVR